MKSGKEAGGRVAAGWQQFLPVLLVSLRSCIETGGRGLGREAKEKSGWEGHVPGSDKGRISWHPD